MKAEMFVCFIVWALGLQELRQTNQIIKSWFCQIYFSLNSISGANKKCDYCGYESIFGLGLTGLNSHCLNIAAQRYRYSSLTIQKAMIPFRKWTYVGKQMNSRGCGSQHWIWQASCMWNFMSCSWSKTCFWPCHAMVRSWPWRYGLAGPLSCPWSKMFFWLALPTIARGHNKSTHNSWNESFICYQRSFH